MTKAHNPWVTPKAPATATVTPAVLNAREAAIYIGVSDRTLYALTASGAIPCVRFGVGKKNPPRYLRSDLDAFLAAHRQTKNEEGGIE